MIIPVRDLTQLAWVASDIDRHEDISIRKDPTEMHSKVDSSPITNPQEHSSLPPMHVVSIFCIAGEVSNSDAVSLVSSHFINF